MQLAPPSGAIGPVSGIPPPSSPLDPLLLPPLLLAPLDPEPLLDMSPLLEVLVPLELLPPLPDPLPLVPLDPTPLELPPLLELLPPLELGPLPLPLLLDPPLLLAFAPFDVVLYGSPGSAAHATPKQVPAASKAKVRPTLRCMESLGRGCAQNTAA